MVQGFLTIEWFKVSSPHHPHFFVTYQEIIKFCPLFAPQKIRVDMKNI